MEEIEQNELKQYELGFLLSPFVPSENLEETVRAEVTAHLDKIGGEVTKTTTPVMKSLAYQIRKRVGHKQTSYRDAYFGTVMFKLDPAKAPAFIESLQTSELVIRFLLIVAPKYKGKEKVSSAPKLAPVKTEKIDEKDKVPVDAKEIDKEIEDLLATT